MTVTVKFKWEARYRSEYDAVIRQYVGESLRHIMSQVQYDSKEFGLPYCLYGVTGNGFVFGERIVK